MAPATMTMKASHALARTWMVWLRCDQPPPWPPTPTLIWYSPAPNASLTCTSTGQLAPTLSDEPQALELIQGPGVIPALVRSAPVLVVKPTSCASPNETRLAVVLRSVRM